MRSEVLDDDRMVSLLKIQSLHADCSASICKIQFSTSYQLTCGMTSPAFVLFVV